MTGIQGFAIGEQGSAVGGWSGVGEVHSQGLVTAEAESRRTVGRLAERVPSFDDGTMALLPDGQMRVVYHLRPNVTWHDGAPFTARDLVFSAALSTDRGLPVRARDAVDRIGAVEAPDDHTFVLVFSDPYYLASALGVELFWPYPEHLLGGAFAAYQASKNASEFLNLPYWTSGYVNLGPFRVTGFQPGEGVTFEAYPGYFLGKPSLDQVRVRVFADQNTLFSNLLAGAVQMFLSVTLEPQLGAQLRDIWTRGGEGTVHAVPGYTRFMLPQWRPAFQREQAVFDVRVRAGLYHALDRETISDAVQAGRRDLVAYSVLSPQERSFAAARDGLRQYTYDPDRARSLLREAGWLPDQEGALRHASDGRRFQTAVWANARWGSETTAIADYWRRLGIEVEEYLKPAVATGDREARASFPGWETTSRYGDDILRAISEPPAGPENRWSGSAHGYNDPRARTLVDAYRRSLTERDQLNATREVSDFVASELSMLLMYYEADYIGVRKGVRALDDVQGGANSNYGLFTRNAHLWSAE
jgi:peptide/nickel transport system substrate-binding protein